MRVGLLGIGWVGEVFLSLFASLGGPCRILLIYIWAFLGFFFDEYILPFTHQKKIIKNRQVHKSFFFNYLAF